ncbi:MAG: VIT1/CCC1 transporter family protein [Spirochaetaceae bacterium]|nr:VIT1/CCC1 transporter family protein [Spirochaetaceae bacterium]
MTDKKLLKQAIVIQRTEMTEYLVYLRLAKICKNEANAKVLKDIAEAEKGHAAFWQQQTGIEVQPDRWHIAWTVFWARLLGLTFTLKRMEKNEGTASHLYSMLVEQVPGAEKLMKDEAEHEHALLQMLDEQILQYAGSIVLGLNDALVELTGSLAGFTFALGDPKTVSVAGLVTGISAAFSMAASEYLSARAENNPQAKLSAVYTGIAYFITVIILIMPYLLLSNIFLALVITLALAVCIIFVFNYYLSVAKELNFKHRFLEMAGISLGVAALSFVVGWVLKNVMGIEG